jgi:biopolymer transport protein ExbD
MSVRLDHGKDELDEVHEINVTPFIDVIFCRSTFVDCGAAAPARQTALPHRKT